MKKKVFVRFMLWQSVLTALLFAGVHCLKTLYPGSFTIEAGAVGTYLMSFYAVSAASAYLIIRSQADRSAVLIRSIIGSTVIKFFFYIAALSVFVLSEKGHAKEIGIYFFALYIIFTVFEKTFLVRTLSRSVSDRDDNVEKET